MSSRVFLLIKQFLFLRVDRGRHEERMSKRRPTSDLNHDNWDVEDEPEDGGSFQVAPQAELQTRKILKPRRKLPQSEAPSNPFQSLASLVAPPTNQPVPVVVSTISTPVEDSHQINTAASYSQPVEAVDLQNQNGNSVDPEKVLGKTNAENSSDTFVQNSVSDTPNLVQPVVVDSSDDQKSESVDETEGEGKGNINETENPTEELDLPDFVDQSDDESEREKEKEERV